MTAQVINSFPIYNPHLDGRPFEWKGNDTGLLLIHGFTATTTEVKPLAEYFCNEGYTVHCPLLTGHYTHPNDLNRVIWQQWVECVEIAYQRLSCQVSKVIVGGESTGGLLSLLLAAYHPEINGVLLYAPALKLTASILDQIKLRLAAPFLPYLAKKNWRPCSGWQGYPVIPLKGALQLIKLENMVGPLLPLIHQPVLVAQGRLDTTVHPSVPELITRRISSIHKEIHWFDQSSHCILLDSEFEQVARLSLDFIHQFTAGD